MVEMIEVANSYILAAYAVSGGLLFLLSMLFVALHLRARKRLQHLEQEASDDT